METCPNHGTVDSEYDADDKKCSSGNNVKDCPRTWVNCRDEESPQGEMKKPLKTVHLVAGSVRRRLACLVATVAGHA